MAIVIKYFYEPGSMYHPYSFISLKISLRGGTARQYLLIDQTLDTLAE